MNVNSILNYEKNSKEDYYGILGCDQSSTKDQILAEFKVKAKECHPDKTGSSQEKFQDINEAKEVLTDSESRFHYDKWLSSGIAMSFKQWKAMKNSVRTSMHWVTPNTSGRMLNMGASKDKENSAKNLLKPDPVSLNESPVSQGEETAKDKKEMLKKLGTSVEGEVDDEIDYEAKPYEDLGFRVETPPPEWSEKQGGDSANKEDEEFPDESRDQVQTDFPQPVHKAELIDRRREQFASNRQDSSIGAMLICDRLSDVEMRKRFRNYEV